MRAGLLVFVGMLLSASAFAADRVAPSDVQATFFNGKTFTASTTSGTQLKMTFTAGGTMTRQPSGKAGKKSSGTWNSTRRAFARVGKAPKPIATPSSQAARISGRSRKAPPPLQCGPNSFQCVAAVDRHCKDFLLLSRSFWSGRS